MYLGCDSPLSSAKWSVKLIHAAHVKSLHNASGLHFRKHIIYSNKCVIIGLHYVFCCHILYLDTKKISFHQQLMRAMLDISIHMVYRPSSYGIKTGIKDRLPGWCDLRHYPNRRNMLVWKSCKVPNTRTKCWDQTNSEIYIINATSWTQHDIFTWLGAVRYILCTKLNNELSLAGSWMLFCREYNNMRCGFLQHGNAIRN